MSSEPPIVSADTDLNAATQQSNAASKKGKKKKKKRSGAKSQTKAHQQSSFPDPVSASKDKSGQSFGRISSSGNNFTGSYS